MPTVTRPSWISCSEARREATPASARIFTRRTASRGVTIGGWIFSCWKRTLLELGEPGKSVPSGLALDRAGGRGLDTMTDLPL